MLNWFLNRLSEPSTWRGLILVASSLGMAITPEQAYAYATLGLALAGGVGVITPDNFK